MDALEAISTRRSTRFFGPQKVSRESIEEIVTFGNCGPSAGDAKPWHFIIIDEPALLDAAASINPFGEMARNVSSGVLVCGDTQLERHSGFWVQDCAVATQNILLAAHALGVGAVWTGVYPVRNRVIRFSQLLGLPGHVIPLSFVLFGYSARRSQPPTDGLIERPVIHINEFKLRR